MDNVKFREFARQYYLLALIILVGLALRLYNLGQESVWFDEAVSIDVSKLGFIDQIRWVFNQSKEGNPPFYYMLLHLWVPVFGDSEFVSRLPSAIFGALSIPVIYAVGKFLFGKRAGLVAALILALSVFHVKYSQEARGYTLMAFLTLVSFYYFLKLTEVWKRPNAVLYVLSAVLLCYTHFYGLFVILVQNILCFTLFLRRGRAGELGFRRWFVLQVLVGLLYIPAVILLVNRFVSVRESFWIPEPDTGHIFAFFVIYGGSVYLIALLALFSVLSLVGPGRLRGWTGLNFWSARIKNASPSSGITAGERNYLLLLWLLVPLLLPYLISIISTPILIFRYAISSSLALYLLAAGGIGDINRRFPVIIISVLIIVLSAFSLNGYYARIEKHQWREAMSEVESHAAPGDYILVYPGYEHVSAEYYLKRGDVKLLPVYDKFPALPGLGDSSIWFIFQAHPSSRLNLKLGIAGKYDIVSESHYRNLDLYRIRKK